MADHWDTIHGPSHRCRRGLLLHFAFDGRAVVDHGCARELGRVTINRIVAPVPETFRIVGRNMSRTIVFTPKAAKPPPTYGQAVKAAGLVFVSGTSPTDPETGAITGTTIQQQTRQCLTNIRAILEEAGSSLDRIVSVTVILADEDDFAGMNEEWLKWFPSDPPARQGAKLPVRIAGLKISIAAIAEA